MSKYRLGVDPWSSDPYIQKIYNRRDIRDIIYKILVWIIAFVSFIGAMMLLIFIILPEVQGTWIDTGNKTLAPKDNYETGYMIYESEQDEKIATIGTILAFPFGLIIAIPTTLLFKFGIFPGIEYLFRKYENKKIEGK